MNVKWIDPAADDVVLYDLDLLVGDQLEAQPEPRVVPYPVEPTTWLEYRCPTCGEAYGEADECPVDHQPLGEVIVSMPFLWLG